MSRLEHDFLGELTIDDSVYYGVQTLRKSIPAVAEGMDIELPAASINDYPRFPYRGMHLDVSRHFFPVDSVKKFIDILALHNM
ncbi:family 20 glycosylhydrolase, partial [Desulfovibrio sp.]|uniref:family 20 glycosylhydrolase n=1 Tax=Desulfovibrio sp. TaxID=885 RepID=UPI003076B561